ncbi:MAG: hypothetical protein CSB24_01435 [Deltaproteobacteria bacterium]|nr:MAG: hypothetical protein CSB24_01435 [Deltaproteobacteria bacterium]
MGKMQVISKGFLATIQDEGRKLCQHLGLAEAGAMDKHALFWGNRLLGNPADAAAVEILLGNASFSFDTVAQIAITGAEMNATLNGQKVPNWTAISISPGDVLKCGMAASGLWAYLTITGGFNEPHFFGSSSTVIREKTGGNQGRRLDAGDIIHYHQQATKPKASYQARVPERYIPNYEEPLTLHFFPGYHYQQFDPESLEQCLDSWYTISQEADRMGYRLSGPPLRRTGDNILSIGVPCGAIQVPTAGEPIILLNDRQCTGGYPVLGVISARDIFRLVQRRPGARVRFAAADLAARQQELFEFYQFFQQ